MHRPNNKTKSGIGNKDYLNNDGSATIFGIGYDDCFDSPVFELHLNNLQNYQEEIDNAQTK